MAAIKLARRAALIVSFCLQPSAGVVAIVENDDIVGPVAFRGLRGHHNHPKSQIDSFDDLHPKVNGVTQNMAPLYDDFLDIMNNAAAQALNEQRAVPAYDDFLHLMKHSAEKAHKPTHLQSDEEQAQMPSYGDFLSALKASSVEALKDPVPSYEDFLRVLKDGAARAMDDRVRNKLHGKTVGAVAERRVRNNPLDKVVYGDDDRIKNNDEDDDTDKLKDELRKLQEEQKKQAQRKGKDGKPKKPLMKRINVLRTQLCWKRPNLWQHEKCMRFLGLHCMQESTGEGICRAFTKEAKNRCETSNDRQFKEDYCALSEALAESYAEEEEEEEEKVDELADKKEDEDIDKELLGDDDGSGGGKGKDGSPAGAEAIGKAGDDEVLEEDGAKEAPAVLDRDGDGVHDSEDKFPDDPNEWRDTDGDGIGDNADKDIDGDGHENHVDKFPFDAKEWLDSDNDGIGDNADKDRDNDGVNDDKDTFPDDPTEWKDSDKDGVGDNKDAYPYNPNCHDHNKPCHDISKNGAPKPGSSADPTTLNKSSLRPLPDQGYDEHQSGKKVNHQNFYTWVGDWQDEFPEMGNSDMASICRENPSNVWCEKFRHHMEDSHFR